MKNTQKFLGKIIFAEAESLEKYDGAGGFALGAFLFVRSSGGLKLFRNEGTQEKAVWKLVTGYTKVELNRFYRAMVEEMHMNPSLKK